MKTTSLLYPKIKLNSIEWLDYYIIRYPARCHWRLYKHATDTMITQNQSNSLRFTQRIFFHAYLMASLYCIKKHECLLHRYQTDPEIFYIAHFTINLAKSFDRIQEQISEVQNQAERNCSKSRSKGNCGKIKISISVIIAIIYIQHLSLCDHKYYRIMLL